MPSWVDHYTIRGVKQHMLTSEEKQDVMVQRRRKLLKQATKQGKSQGGKV